MTIATANPPAVTCSVLGESRGRSMVVQGRIVSTAALGGTYRLLVTKIGPSGQSRIAQSGAFSAQGGEAVLVGSMTLGLEAGARIDAVLDVTAGTQHFTCRSESENRL